MINISKIVRIYLFHGKLSLQQKKLIYIKNANIKYFVYIYANY
jgi:hypothetical protein